MEATTATKNVSTEDQELPAANIGTQDNLLMIIERCTYPTVKQLAHETGRTEGRIKQSLRSLEKQGLVRRREGGMHGTLYLLVPKPEKSPGLFDELTNAPEVPDDGKVPCDVCGERYTSKGIGPHRVACKKKASSSTPKSTPVAAATENEDEEEDDEPEEPTVVTEASSNAARFEDLLEGAQNQGWTVDHLQAHKSFNGGVLKLSFTNGDDPSKVAS